MHFNRNICKSNLFKVNPWNIECFLCRLNYLSISHGNNSIDHYCGNLTGKVIFVSRDYLVLTFHSNEKFDPNNRGFEIFFTEDVNMPGKWMYSTISILLYQITLEYRHMDDVMETFFFVWQTWRALLKDMGDYFGISKWRT